MPAEPGGLDGGAEALLDRLHRAAFPFDHEIFGDHAPYGHALPARLRLHPCRCARPTPDMGKETIGEPHGRLALLRLDRVGGAAIEGTAIEIDKATASVGRTAAPQTAPDRVPV